MFTTFEMTVETIRVRLFRGRLYRVRLSGTRARSGPQLSAVILVGGLLASSLPTTGSAADLVEVYDRAREYDSELRAATFDYEAAQQQLPLARSAFRPQLNAGADGSIGHIDTDLAHDRYRSLGITLSATQTLFNRANGALVDQAKLGMKQADAQFLAVEQALILRVATAYFDVLRAQADLVFSRSELEAIRRQREQAVRRFDVGLVPVTDVRTAEAQYDLAVAQEIAAANQLSTAQEALRVISNTDDEDALHRLARDLPLVSPDPDDIDAWVELALEQNLELVGARLASESAATQIDIERGARYPTLDLVGTASSSKTTQDGRTDADVAELALQLRIPILTGGRVNAQVAQARARAESSAEQLVAQERAATQQARDGYRGVLTSISRVQALRQALVSTQKSAEATEAGFRAGTRTSIDVLQALRDVYRARSDYAGARYDYLINTLNLKAAAGTLSENDLEAVNRFLVPTDPES